MKFRRMLAALLSALMITSCMSFVAGAQETQTATEPVAYYTAKARGCDIDKPRNLAKSVTVE